MSTKSSRVVLITGASRGIGEAMVREFARAGDQVIGVARTVSALEKNKDLAGYFECDVGNRDSVREVMKAVSRKFGRIDVLVNNAGVAAENSWDASDDDSLWHQIIDVNLNGTYYFSKYALPMLVDGGVIVNIASVLGLFGVPDMTAYCSAKHAVVGLTRSLALKLAPRKIRVNAICPGWTKTQMATGRCEELGLDVEELGKSIPLGRMVEPDEVAKLALFISSKDSGMITGQTLRIDGGEG